MAQVLIIADRSSAVIQPGQPPAQMAAWLMTVPNGSDALTTAKAFVSDLDAYHRPARSAGVSA
jgi:hypothetical protein